jgi:outer membrane protein assembly factor BamA
MPDTVLNNTSFLGLTIGIGYYHNDKNFINLIFGATISNENPIPVGIDYVELHEQYNTLFIGLSTNHRISLFLKNKLSYSLGLNYIDYKVLNYRDAYDTSYYTINKSTLGLSIGLEYQIIRYFSVGMKLKSSLYNFSSNTFEYNHIAYLDFIFRLGAKREQ